MQVSFSPEVYRVTKKAFDSTEPYEFDDAETSLLNEASLSIIALQRQSKKGFNCTGGDVILSSIDDRELPVPSDTKPIISGIFFQRIVHTTLVFDDAKVPGVWLKSRECHFVANGEVVSGAQLYVPVKPASVLKLPDYAHLQAQQFMTILPRA